MPVFQLSGKTIAAFKTIEHEAKEIISRRFRPQIKTKSLNICQKKMDWMGGFNLVVHN